MASNGNSGGELLRAGGILSILAGTHMTIIGVWVWVWWMLPQFVIGLLPSGVVWVCSIFTAGNVFFPFSLYWSSYQWGVFGGCFGILGIVAIIGGVSVVRRWRFGLSLAGAICALPTAVCVPAVVFGILPVIFVARGKKNLVQRGKEMASNGNSKGGLLTIGGVLSIIGGALEVICGGMLGFTIAHIELLGVVPPHLSPGIFWRLRGADELSWLTIVGGLLVLLGIIAIVGGISAKRRYRFGLSLAGAICAIPLAIFVGILAVIFVALGKSEFGTKD